MILLPIGWQDILGTTDQYPETLSNTISTIRDSFPAVTPLTSVVDILTAQENVSTTMAHRLESLAAHYDQMAVALRESEAGEAFSEEDLQGPFLLLY
jgi:autophagy-related protein 17